MLKSVEWLDAESHTVRLDPGSIELGRMNGNIDSPTVEMMPATASLLAMNVTTSHPSRSPTNAAAAPAKPSAGAIIIQG